MKFTWLQKVRQLEIFDIETDILNKKTYLIYNYLLFKDILYEMHCYNGSNLFFISSKGSFICIIPQTG